LGTIFVGSRNDDTDMGSSVERRMVIIDPNDLVGRTFNTEEDGQCFRSPIVQEALDEDSKRQNNPRCINFIYLFDGKTVDEILTYIDVVEHIDRDNKNGEI
jgi:hypothetical protein